MREEGDGEDVDDLQDSMGSSAVQGASAEVIDVNILIKVSWTLREIVFLTYLWMLRDSGVIVRLVGSSYPAVLISPPES